MNYILTDAHISDCGTYRYWLRRVWNKELPACLFIMLNPSTADGYEDDPTIRRCVNYAARWGFGSLIVCNLTPYRATGPKQLEDIPTSELDTNLQFIDTYAAEAAATIFAWGGNADKRGQAYRMASLLMLEHKGAMCLGVSQSGQPLHPLYQKGDSLPLMFTAALQWVRDNAGSVQQFAQQQLGVTHGDD